MTRLAKLERIDDTSEQLTVTFATEARARECAEDTITLLARTLQRSGDHTRALLVFDLNSKIVEPHQIRNAQMGLWLFEGPEADSARRALVSLLAVLTRDENEVFGDKDPTLEDDEFSIDLSNEGT